MSKRKMPAKRKLIWVLLLIGFAAMEFPGVFFFKDKSEPFIFGLPFIYGFILICWIYMCLVLLWAYRINWGERPEPKGEGGDE
ncbi:MAG: hypothetical protein ACOX5F_06470 [Anaerovoracaceae bacterium]|jgi:hypothetical protein